MKTFTPPVGRELQLPAASRLATESPAARAARAERMRFYSSRRWRRISAYQLAHDPLCCWCGHLADMVDHVIPRRIRPALAYRLDNLRSCCRACHAVHGS